MSLLLHAAKAVMLHWHSYSYLPPPLSYLSVYPSVSIQSSYDHDDKKHALLRCVPVAARARMLLSSSGVHSLGAGWWGGHDVPRHFTR